MSDRTVIIALDFPDPKQALQFVDQLSPQQCAVKVGFELFVVGGPILVEQLVDRGFRVFLDLKFHDIPNTVASVCAAATRLGVWMLNVHASGGPAMLTAARNAIDQQSGDVKPILLAVTVLTSLDQNSLLHLGIDKKLSEVVQLWAQMAQQCGVEGVVCSAQEASLVRSHCPPPFEIVTPGIRFPDNQSNDQKRIVTPADARDSGATCIVVGRPITQATHPVDALEEFRNAFVGA